jgi:hypothetical protein
MYDTLSPSGSVVLKRKVSVSPRRALLVPWILGISGAEFFLHPVPINRTSVAAAAANRNHLDIGPP